MSRPENGIYIIQGEVNLVVTAMRRNSRWSSHTHQDDEQDPLINSFSQLKDVLNTVSDLDELSPNEFLGPFLEVIRSEDTTGPITGLALSSVNKFLAYRLIDPNASTAGAAIENIADAVTHARFVGTDPSSDEVVLMKILHFLQIISETENYERIFPQNTDEVLRTLLLTPAGAMLTNESVCEIMQSCFRICFEMRLSELLRKSAEHTLMDMVQLLFSRLPYFKEDAKWATNLKKLMKMRPGGMDQSRTGKHKKKSPKTRHRKMPHQRGHSPAAEHVQSQAGPYSPAQSNAVTPTASSPQCSPPTATDQCAAENGGQEPPESMLTPPESAAVSPEESQQRPTSIATTPVSSLRTVVDIQEGFQKASDREDMTYEEQGSRMETESMGQENDGDVHQNKPEEDSGHSAKEYLKVEGVTEVSSEADPTEEGDGSQSLVDHSSDASHETEYINPRGVRFTPHQQTRDGTSPPVPYGLPCVRELFRFLITLTNPTDRHNTDVMVHMGLSLLTVALESGADQLAGFSSLLCLVKDDLCKNLFFLLQSERLSLFAASIRVCFLLFESTRSHLKFQLEMYLQRLMDIMVSESPRISYEQREIALESIVQLLRVPGLVTELYLNYDCDLYCTNLFEDLMKLLSKNAFPVSGLFTTHLLSLDALLAVIDSIEQHCHHRILHSASRSTTAVATQQQHTSPPPQVKVEGVDEEVPASVAENTTPSSWGSTEEQTAQQVVVTNAKENVTDAGKQKKEGRSGPKIRPNRMRVSTCIPTEEELAAIKHKKKLYQTGTEQFNMKPTKGIAFLQENSLLSAPVDPGEIVTFLKENPRLDKKMIGEFISNKKNGKILEAFQKSFHFEEARIDECLRMYVESFRLPGEAPVISYLMEHFADHWHKTNGEPFADTDAAYTLAYAILMLNTDQHNTNAKKQNIPMTSQEFKRNLSKVNGGEDFDQEMLDEIYTAIRNDEIVMPEEQMGLVRENYLWKVLLRRGTSKDGSFIHAPTGAFDRDLFTLVWGPSVAALSFVFDKSLDETIIQKAISGFRKCAMISAHYGISDVFDNLVISLCKFTTLLSSAESAENIPISFGNNMKAQLAARTVFGLAHRHGDILREGWKNILDCLLQLYRAKLLPEVLIHVEDFLDPAGRISLIREETQVQQRSESGVLSSFYSYFTLTETTQQRGPSPEEEEATRKAHQCIQECHVEQLITESKFLRMDSLKELLKALVFASRCPDAQESLSDAHCDEEAAVFYLELLIKVVLQNRDRIGPNWQMIRDHIYGLIVNANEHSFLVERAVVGLLRLAMRLLRREEIAVQVLASQRILLMMKPVVVHSVRRQVSFGLHDLLKTNAANIHSCQDWQTLFTLLEVVGAGTNPPPIMQADPELNVPEVISDAGAQSDSELGSNTNISELGDRGYTSDSELYEAQRQSKTEEHSSSSSNNKQQPAIHGSWLLVNREDVSGGPDAMTTARRPSQPQENQYCIELREELRHLDNKSLTKSCETLAFLVRDAAHVTPHNFESCVHCIRMFVEASMNGGRPMKHSKHDTPKHGKEKRMTRRQRKEEAKMKKSKSTPSHLSTAPHDSEEENETDGCLSLSIQLLDLMHTLHTRAATIFSSWAEEESRHKDAEVQDTETGETIDAGTSTLWSKCWCPLLQGIARLCCDSRWHVRNEALNYLQKALLVHDLQTLSATEWEACFSKVLFPLLFKLLDNINTHDPSGIEETRIRASALLCKVFLQHLTPLLSLPTFTALWLTILDFMDKYMHADNSDLLYEAVPESLKNMLLVMHTAGILQSQEQESQLWKLTWDRINTFLPNLHEAVFKLHDMDPRRQQQQAGAAAAAEESSVQEPVSTQPQAQAAPQQQVQQVPPSSPQMHSAAPASTEHIHGNTTPTPAGAAAAAEPRPDSPLSTGGVAPPSAAGGQYILHPPLPSVGTPSGTTLPILLNPDIMQGTTIPIISPQGTPERKPEVAVTVERQ